MFSLFSHLINFRDDRAHVAVIQSLSWTLGLCILPYIYWLVRDWFPFFILTTIPLAAFLFIPTWVLYRFYTINKSFIFFIHFCSFDWCHSYSSISDWNVCLTRMRKAHSHNLFDSCFHEKNRRQWSNLQFSNKCQHIL